MKKLLLFLASSLIFLLAPVCASGQAALYVADPFVSSKLLGVSVDFLIENGHRLDEIGVTPDRNWALVSGQDVVVSSGFPVDCENKIKQYVFNFWTVDVVAFTQDGNGWAVIADQGFEFHGDIPNEGVLYAIVADVLAVGHRIKDLSFTADGWVVTATNGMLLGSGVPQSLWDAILDLEPAQRTLCQVSIVPDGSWFLVADDWFASNAVPGSSVESARWFQREQYQMDRVAFCAGGGFVLYGNDFYKEPGGYIGQMEYGIEAKKNIWDLMEEYEVPGLSVAYIRSGQVAWARGYGELEYGGGRAAYTTDLFDMASVSKPLSAMSMLSLLEGRDPITLELSALEVAESGPEDNPVQGWLAGTEIGGVPFGGMNITDQLTLAFASEYTLRRLLSHTASLDPWGSTRLYPDDTPPDTTMKLRGWSTGDKYRLSKRVRYNVDIDGDGTVDKPGDVYRYSGGGFMVAEAMTETLTGQDFRQFLDNTLIAWLDLKNTTPRHPLPPQFTDRAAWPHIRLVPVAADKLPIYPWTAAGGISSSPSDVARAVITLMNFGMNPEGTAQILDSSTVEEMMTDQAPGSKRYGLGLNLSASKVRLSGGYFDHGGSHGGAKTKIAGHPRNRTGLVLAVNAGHDEANDLLDLIYKDFRAYHGW